MSSHTYGRRERRESLQETAIKLTSSDTQSVPSALIKPTLFKWCSQKKIVFIVITLLHLSHAGATGPRLGFVPTQYANLLIAQLSALTCQRWRASPANCNWHVVVINHPDMPRELDGAFCLYKVSYCKYPLFSGAGHLHRLYRYIYSIFSLLKQSDYTFHSPVH